MENREKLMQCALELFYAKGYDATGVQEIVDSAGVTKPTLYYYFGSKRGLLKALLDDRNEKMRACIREELDKTRGIDKMDIREKLYFAGGVAYRFFMEEQKFYMLMLALFFSPRENEAYQTVYPYLQEVYKYILYIFESSADELGNMHGRQKQFAISFIGMLNHWMVYALDQGLLHSDGQKQMDAVISQFLHGIFS